MAKFEVPVYIQVEAADQEAALEAVRKLLNKAGTPDEFSWESEEPVEVDEELFF